MLTLGQASCLVLGTKPKDPVERKKAKEHLEKSGLIAVHMRNQDPLQPLAIGVNVYERDPFKFISYPDSPPLASTAAEDVSDIPSILDTSNSDINDDASNSNDSNNYCASKKRKVDETVIPFCKARLVNIMREIATEEDPYNNTCYSQEFLTANDQYRLMCGVFPQLEHHCSVHQLQHWIGQAKIWGSPIRSRAHQRASGRNLWVVDEGLRAFVTDTSDSVKAYWRYLQNDTDCITIGYARKSPTSETAESRVRLLQLMVNKLYFRGKCEEVYVSPVCSANQPILERDSPKRDRLLQHLKGSLGDISDLVARVHLSQRSFRLVIIDYAGLSTSPKDVRTFLEQCRKIKEVVVDHGSSFEILSRFDLLENDDIQKFQCRQANVQRSK